MKIVRSLIFLGYCILSSHIVFANQEEGRQIIRFYSDAVYKAHPVSWGAINDDNGTIYFGNRSVVLTYDGVNWDKIRIKLDAPVYAIKKGKDGRIYLGIDGDLGYLEVDKMGEMVFHSLLKYLPKQHRELKDVWKVHLDGDAVYFQSKEKLMRWDNGVFKVWLPETLFHFSYMIHGELYIRDDAKGLMKMKGEELVLVDPQFKGKEVSKRIYSMLPYDEDKILISTNGEGLFLYDISSGQPAKRFYTSDESLIFKSRIYSGAKLQNGNYALSTRAEGVIIVNPEGIIVRKIDTESGLKTNDIRHVYQDMQGGMWLLSNEGIYRVALDIPLTFWNNEDGLKGSLNDVLEFDKVSYVATSAGVFYKQENKFLKVAALNDECWKFQILETSDTKTLLVASSSGVYEINIGKATRVIDRKGCTYLYFSPQLSDKLWVSNNDTLSIYGFENNNWQHLGNVDSLNSSILDIKEDQQQNSWIGTRTGGLYMIPPVENLQALLQPTIKSYKQSSGFELLADIRVEILNDSIFVLAGHKIYLYQVEKDSFRIVQTHEINHPKDTIETIFMDIDDKGDFWIQRNESDYNLRFEKALCANDLRFKIESSPFKMIPRMLAKQVYHHSDGSLWLIFNSAIYRFEQNRNYVKERNHKTLIQKLVTSQDTTFKSILTATQIENNWGLPKEFKYKFNDLTFWFSSSCLRQESSNKFQFKLEGDENRWSEWSDQPVAYFTNLHEGDYKFMARSKNFDENISDISVYSFSILPPWYRSLYAYLAYLVFSIFFIRSLIKLNTSRIRKSNELLEEKVNVRTAEIVNQNTKIQSQQQEIVVQNEELRLLNKEKNFLLGAVAHDLKNPLNSIYSVSQLIKMEDSQLCQDQIEYINQIESISLGLTEKVNEILDVTVIDANQNKVPLKRGEVTGLLKDVIKNLQAVATRKNIKLVYKNPEVTFFASYEKNYMRKVLQNLLDNAIKFSQKGTQIFITLSRPDDKLRIAIKDQGPGISEADQKRLFQRFTTLSARPTNGEKSTGLGLSIVKRCVEAMNGKVWCESHPGEGATFIIEV